MKEGNHNYEHTFMHYPFNIEQLAKQRRQEKTLEELQNVPSKDQQMEFEILYHAEIPESAFYLKKKKMDRYSDIWAYDHSRIKLPQIGPEYYINGNQVKSLVDNQIFSIFSQAPIHPFDNFWEAAYYKDVKLIIMLCMFVDPKRGRQSQPYWPNPKQSVLFSSGKIKVTNESQKIYDEEFVETYFRMEGPEGTRTVKHLHWMGWSDLKKPVDHKMQRFEAIIDLCLELIKNKKMIWIHCSAGIGRTGTLGGILEAIRLYEKEKKFSIFKIVENMRKYRYHAVQTEEQYRFLYSYLSKRFIEH